MPAAVYLGDGEMAVQDLPMPVPGPGEVLVEVSRCGICGTDLHLVLDRMARPGSVLGHEWSAVVAETRDTTSDWPVGARVVSNPTPGCGECRACRRGRPSVCLHRQPPDFLSFSGAFCRYLAVGAERLAVIPEALGTREAALAEPTAIALHTVNVSGVTAEDRVLVTGAGPVGLLTLAVLRARGVTDISVSEPAPARRARAAELGAARVLSPDELPQPDLARAVPDPYTFVFECSGRAEAAERGLDQLDAAGTLVFVGTGREAPRINQNRMIIFELTAIGAYNYDNEGFAPALQLLADGALDLDLLIEPEDIGLGDIRATMDRLAAGAIPGKVLVRPAAP